MVGAYILWNGCGGIRKRSYVGSYVNDYGLGEEGMNSVVTFGGALDKGMNSMVNFGGVLDEDMNLVVDFGGTLDDGMNGMVVSGFSRSSSGAGSKNHGL